MSPVAAIWVASAVGAALFFLAGVLSGRSRGRVALAFPETVREPAAEATATPEPEGRFPERAREPAVAPAPEGAAGGEAGLERRPVYPTEQVRRVASSARREEGVGWAPATDEQRRDAPQIGADATEGKPVGALELRLEVEVLRRRLEAMADLERENARLRGAAEERDLLRSKLEELTAEAASLRAAGLSRAKRPARPAVAAAPRRGVRATEARLQSLLQGIAKSSGMRTAVLGDELGLPIAGFGDHVGPLAAFGGFIDSIASKSRDFLPMDGLRRIEVEDERGAAVSAFPLALGDSRIFLATLTVGKAPPAAKMTELVRSAASLVQ